jgi:hypothetical protein
MIRNCCARLACERGTDRNGRRNRCSVSSQHFPSNVAFCGEESLDWTTLNDRQRSMRLLCELLRGRKIESRGDSHDSDAIERAGQHPPIRTRELAWQSVKVEPKETLGTLVFQSGRPLRGQHHHRVVSAWLSVTIGREADEVPSDLRSRARHRLPVRANGGSRTTPIARNLVATVKVKAALRAAHLRTLTFADRAGTRGPLPGSTYYRSYGSRR